MFEHSPEFRRLIEGNDDVDLVRVALEFSKDAYADLDESEHLAAIERLAARVRDRITSGTRPRVVVGHINWVLFVEEKFQGNTADYYDPRNSYINQVLARKMGIPISLSVLYQSIAARVGLELEGVNFPGHYMLRSRDPADLFFLDIFQGGQVLNPRACEVRLSELLGQPIELNAELIRPCPARLVVTRMLRNLKTIYARIENESQLLRVNRRLAALHPEDLAEQRDWGLACLRANRPGEAIDPLQAYLASAPEGADTDHIRIYLRLALREIASRN